MFSCRALRELAELLNWYGVGPLRGVGRSCPAASAKQAGQQLLPGREVWIRLPRSTLVQVEEQLATSTTTTCRTNATTRSQRDVPRNGVSTSPSIPLVISHAVLRDSAVSCDRGHDARRARSTLALATQASKRRRTDHRAPLGGMSHLQLLVPQRAGHGEERFGILASAGVGSSWRGGDGVSGCAELRERFRELAVGKEWEGGGEEEGRVLRVVSMGYAAGRGNGRRDGARETGHC